MSGYVINLQEHNNNNNNNNNNDDDDEFVVRKLHAYMFKCALQLKIHQKNERYTLKMKLQLENIPN